MEDNMHTENDFTQEELHDYYVSRHYNNLDDYYNWLVQWGVKANVQKTDDNDLDPNRFLCDRVWNKRSNR